MDAYVPIPTSTSTALPFSPPGRIANAVDPQVVPPSAGRIMLNFPSMGHHPVWLILPPADSVRNEGYGFSCKSSANFQPGPNMGWLGAIVAVI